jgi:Tol biopolymer transport system component
LVSGSSQVAVFDLKKRTSRVLVQNGSNPRYTSSGHLIYYRGGTLFAAPFSLSKLEVTGPEAPVVEHVASTMEDGADFSISETGVLVYMAGAAGDRGGNTVLNWADMKGNIQPISEAKQWGTGRLSPDGSHVANSIRSGAGEDIWTLELQRRIPTRLTFEGINYFPVWSPDGKWIAFGGDRGAKHALYRVASDASTKPELLLETDKTPTPSAWTPDGKTLVYDQQGEDRKFRLWSVTLPGGKPVQLHENNLSERNGQLSPDGHWLAYESVESGTQEIYVQPFPGGGAKSRISTQGGQAPRWSHNGKELFYWSNGVDKQLMSVAVQTGPNLRPDLPQVLFKLGAGTTWDPAPDGKRFLVEVNQAANDTGRHLETVVNWLDELSHRIPVK